MELQKEFEPILEKIIVSSQLVIKICLFVLISCSTIYSQSYDFQKLPSNKKQIEVRFLKPFLKNNFSQSALAGAYKLSLNIPISSEFNILGEIPYSYTKYETNNFFGKYKYDESGFGNIFIGAQSNPKADNGKRSIVTFGVFLPTASEKAGFEGLAASYYNMQEFIPNSFGIYANYAYQKIYLNELKFGFELGPNVVVPTSGPGSSQLFLHYGISGGAEINKLLINLEFLGTLFVTEDAQNFSDRFVHQLDFGFGWKGDKIIPKIFYKVYLTDFISNNISGVLGIGVLISAD